MATPKEHPKEQFIKLVQRLKKAGHHINFEWSTHTYAGIETWKVMADGAKEIPFQES